MVSGFDVQKLVRQTSTLICVKEIDTVEARVAINFLIESTHTPFL